MRKLAVVVTMLLNLLMGCHSVVDSDIKTQRQWRAPTAEEKEDLKQDLIWLLDHEQLTYIYEPDNAEVMDKIREGWQQRTNGDYIVSSLETWTEDASLVEDGLREVVSSLDEAYQAKLKKEILSHHSVVNQVTPDPFRYDYIFSEADIKNALESYPSKPTGVRYNGEWFQYENRELSDATRMIAMKISKSPSGFTTIFNSLSATDKAKFQVNTETAGSASSTEPFDLIQGTITGNLKWIIRDVTTSVFPISKIVVTKLVHKRLHDIFGSSPAQDPRGAAYSSFLTFKKPNRGQSVLLCAGKMTTQLRHMGVANSFITFAMPTEEAVGVSTMVNCGGKDYEVKYESFIDTEIGNPVAYDLSQFDLADNTFDVLFTFALTDSMSDSEIQKMLLYLQARDLPKMLAIRGKLRRQPWQVVEDHKQVKTMEAYTRLFPKLEMVIPIAHVFEASRYDLGSVYSRHVVLERETFNEDLGRDIKVRLNVFFPKALPGEGLKKYYLA